MRSVVLKCLAVATLSLFTAYAGAATDQEAKRPAEAAKDSYVRFASVGVRVARPEGFEKATGFDGFQQKETGASVMIVRIPGPFAETTSGFTTEKMNERGMRLESKQETQIDGRPGLLLNVSQKVNGTTVSKWIAASGDESQTILVTATCPEDQEKALAAALKASVLSTRWDSAAPAPTPDPELPFTVKTKAPLKLTSGVNKTLLFTTEGKLPVTSVTAPIFVVAPSTGDVAIPDKRAFALTRLQQTEQITGLAVKSTDPVQLDEMSGFETVAQARDAGTGSPLTIYQAIVFQDKGYILLQGIVGAQHSDDYLPVFKEMARTLKRKPGK